MPVEIVNHYREKWLLSLFSIISNSDDSPITFVPDSSCRIGPPALLAPFGADSILKGYEVTLGSTRAARITKISHTSAIDRSMG